MTVNHGVNTTELHSLFLAGTTCWKSLAFQPHRALPTLLQVVLHSWKPHREAHDGAGRGAENPLHRNYPQCKIQKVGGNSYSRKSGYQTPQLSSISAADDQILSIIMCGTSPWGDGIWHSSQGSGFFVFQWEFMAVISITKWASQAELQDKH